RRTEDAPVRVLRPRPHSVRLGVLLLRGRRGGQARRGLQHVLHRPLGGRDMSKFEVDTRGFAQLQAGREPWRLAKELVSNAFDEAEVTMVMVDLQMRPEGAVLVVADDGPGFRDLKDAFTLYSWTYKREDPTTRGRFNLDEKEIMALAKKGSIKTTYGSVFFTTDSRLETGEQLVRG